MLTLFEDITYELTEAEQKLLPLLVQGFQARVGPEKAISNKQVRKSLLEKRNINVADARIRKLINHIRILNLVPGLIATSKGYYISRDPSEVARYIESLRQRSNEIKRVAQAMVQYLEQLKKL